MKENKSCLLVKKNRKSLKVIVCHPMRQHSYMTALALEEKGILFSYCTSIYYNKNKYLYKILNLLLNDSEKMKMKSRSNDNLDKYVNTFSVFWGLLYLLFERIDKTKNSIFTYKFQDILATQFGKKVARYAIRNEVDLIIGYDTWSYAIIKELKNHNSKIKVVIDFSSLYSEEILSIINKDIAINPNTKVGYSKSLEKFKEKYIKKFRYEKNNCDYFFSPSSVVDHSLLKYGVDINKIFRCIYGMYFKKIDEVKVTNSNSITFTYIGRLSYAKGVHYLLDAFNKINRPDFKLQLIGNNVDNFKLDGLNNQITYLGVLLHDNIPNVLKNTDIMVTESLYDGFSLAILEGFSYNIPVICTDNTGVKDFVQNGINGYVINPFDSKEMYDKVLYLLDNKELITDMKYSVKRLVNNFTWSNYNDDVINAINSIFSGYGGKYEE